MVFELHRQLIHKMTPEEIAEMSAKEREALPLKYRDLPVTFKRTLADGTVGKAGFHIGFIKKAYLNPREGIFADLRLQGEFEAVVEDGTFIELAYVIPKVD